MWRRGHGYDHYRRRRHSRMIHSFEAIGSGRYRPMLDSRYVVFHEAGRRVCERKWS